MFQTKKLSKQYTDATKSICKCQLEIAIGETEPFDLCHLFLRSLPNILPFPCLNEKKDDQT